MLSTQIPSFHEVGQAVSQSPIATLAQVQEVLSQGPLAGTPQVKLQISAIHTVARASGCSPHDLPADPRALRNHLSRISPAMAGLTRGSWSSVRSRVLKALQAAEVPVIASRRVHPLTEEWARLYQAIHQNGHKAALSRFIGHLSDRKVAPHQVDDDVVAQFAGELNKLSMRGRPTLIVRAAIRGWNTLVETCPIWPQQRLALQPRDRGGYVFPTDRFLPSFQKSLAEYIQFLADPPEEDDAPLRGLRPITLNLREFQFRQMASVLVHRGAAIDTITSVADLATRESIDVICDFFTARHGRMDSAQILGLLAALRPYARYHLRDRELTDWIGRRIRRLMGGKTRRFGLTEKNRRRIAVFKDPAQVRDLLLLPYKLLKRAESGRLSPAEAARLIRAAVAVELEIMCPIRLQNLSEINVETDFVRSRIGKNAALHLFIPGSRTKNGEDIEMELPRETVNLIELYLSKYRNLLIDPEHRGKTPRFLFPKSDGTAKLGRMLADSVCRVMERELGIKFNIHLFRHLGCFLYLRNHPGQIDVMRRVLGHKDVNTTMRYYAFVEQSDAFRLFDQHVLQIRQEAMRPSRRPVTIRRGGR